MIKFFLLLNIVLLLSEARENPFFPAEGMEELPLSSNVIQSYTPLKRAAVILPDSARVIKEVTIRYQNLDGSIDTTSISLDHSVDWHLPLFVSQSYGKSENKQPKSKVKKPPPKSAYNKLVDFGEASFWQLDKTIKIKTDDKLIRHFMMINPHRIVMDFKRNANFRSKSYKVSGKPFTNIRLGNHKGYYRVVVELDGQYRYTITQSDSEILLTCY